MNCKGVGIITVYYKRLSGRRGGYYPHPSPNNVVLIARGWGILYIIRYKTPPPPINYTIYIRYEFLFVGVGV